MSLDWMNCVWKTGGLSSVAKLAALLMAEQADTSGRGRVDFDHLAEWAGCSAQQLVAACYELEEFAWARGFNFESERRRGDDAHIIAFCFSDGAGHIDFDLTAPVPAHDVGVRSPVTLIDPRRARIYAKTQGQCFYCCEAAAEHLDHMHPQSRGGSDVDENMIGACTGCNTQKKDRTVEEYRAFLAHRRRAACMTEIRFYGEVEAA